MLLHESQIKHVSLFDHLFFSGSGDALQLHVGMPSGVDYRELEGSLPAIASLNASYSQASLSIPSPYYPPLPPGERRAFSDVRRTFCLFVTFDLLFITLLWIIELNVSFYCVFPNCLLAQCYLFFSLSCSLYFLFLLWLL